jgi:hypothetical protein
VKTQYCSLLLKHPDEQLDFLAGFLDWVFIFGGVLEVEIVNPAARAVLTQLKLRANIRELIQAAALGRGQTVPRSWVLIWSFESPKHRNNTVENLIQANVLFHALIRCWVNVNRVNLGTSAAAFLRSV